MLTVLRLYRSLISSEDENLSSSGSTFDGGSTSRAAKWRRFACVRGPACDRPLRHPCFLISKYQLCSQEVNGGEPAAGYFESLLKRARSNTASAKAHKQIDKDLNRTFGSLKGLRVPPQEALRSLRNVLQACAFLPKAPSAAYA